MAVYCLLKKLFCLEINLVHIMSFVLLFAFAWYICHVFTSNFLKPFVLGEFLLSNREWVLHLDANFSPFSLYAFHSLNNCFQAHHEPDTVLALVMEMNKTKPCLLRAVNREDMNLIVSYYFMLRFSVFKTFCTVFDYWGVFVLIVITGKLIFLT